MSSTLNTLRWRRGVAVGCRIHDQEVAGLSLGWALRVKTLGDVGLMLEVIYRPNK